MWKFKDLYEQVSKAILEKSVDKWKKLRLQDPLNIIPKHFNDIEDDAFHWHHHTPDGQIERNFTTYPEPNPCEETTRVLNHIDEMQREIDDISGWGEPGINYTEPAISPHYAQCNKCDPNNALFYDTGVYDSCPRCKELRMEPDEFLKESDMEL